MCTDEPQEVQTVVAADHGGSEVEQTCAPGQVIASIDTSDATVSALSRATPESVPFGELPANRLDVEACVREVVDSLTSRQTRDTSGRYIAGNPGAVTTGARSDLLWAALAPAKRELVARVKADRGVNGDAAETFLGLVDGYAETRLFRQSMFIRLVDLGGAVTTKGKARSLYAAYLQALDRETKLATLLGLERRPKDALPSTPAEAIAQRGPVPA